MHNTNISENKRETVSLVKVFCLFVWVPIRLSGWQPWTELDVNIHQWLQCGLWLPVLLEGILVTFADWNYKPITKDVPIW